MGISAGSPTSRDPGGSNHIPARVAERLRRSVLALALRGAASRLWEGLLWESSVAEDLLWEASLAREAALVGTLWSAALDDDLHPSWAGELCVLFPNLAALAPAWQPSPGAGGRSGVPCWAAACTQGFRCPWDPPGVSLLMSSAGIKCQDHRRC